MNHPKNTKQNSFGTKTALQCGDKTYQIFSLQKLDKSVKQLPFSLKILLENVLRNEDGINITADDISAIVNWQPSDEPEHEIAFTPARVVMQDFTGVPAIVDLAAMRDAMTQLGGDASAINPQVPAELVIDHSVQVDAFGTPDAATINADIEYQRNQERYEFLRWGQKAFTDLKVVPPSTGIVHQVNLEYLARVIFSNEQTGELIAYPDTLVGTDSHTTMINGLGVLGWGVGGIEAEAAMLGQPVSMLIPKVVGFELTGQLPEGATATDLVLTVTQQLRNHGVVGKFVEFFGDGLSHLPLADRATIANMAPEYGATCGLFPIDEETLQYLRLTNRDENHIQFIEDYAKHQGLWREPGMAPNYSELLSLDMSTVVPCIAGPKRPQDRIRLDEANQIITSHLHKFQDQRSGEPTNDEAVALLASEGGGTAVGAEESDFSGSAKVTYQGETFHLKDGACVIAAITSCTNTSNPHVIIGAGLMAKKARELGLKTKPWVKTSLAPGSRVVTDYLEKAQLMDDLEALGFDIVGYGCTTCIGNSGPLPDEIRDAIQQHKLIVSSVLSGNRNFEGRIHQDVKMNFLASPPLVVAYALAGRTDFDPYNDVLATTPDNKAVYLKDLWPSSKEISDLVAKTVTETMFEENYQNVFSGDERWQTIKTPETDQYAWQPESSYIRQAPYFDGITTEVPEVRAISNARCLLKLGDSITTDHISPAGAIKADSPAGKYLLERGIEVKDFNSYGSRRGNHEVMIRGTFANVRLRNQLAPGTEGGYTTLLPDGEQMSVFDAAQVYAERNTPLIVIAGKEYGTGSSRDWAAKGSILLGVRAVIAESFERIHRSNLIGMGVLPLQFKQGESHTTLGLTGKETFYIELPTEGKKQLTIKATGENDYQSIFQVDVRIDTPKEWEYFVHGGILQYVLRRLRKG